jgi:AraC-like DNA-binding protein
MGSLALQFRRTAAQSGRSGDGGVALGLQTEQQRSLPGHRPRSQEIRFWIFSTRLWSVNLSPLGWARFVRQPAHEYANVLIEGYDHPAFGHFRPLVDRVFGPEPDAGAEFERIVSFLDGIDMPRLPNEDRITSIYIALLNPQLTTVGELAEELAINERTLGRICLKVFGFTPKILIRRQRFLRSLADFTLDPSLKWIGEMDSLYHDQAQFVRDFKQFMGMTPSQYAALDKPIMAAVMRERDRYSRDIVRSILRDGDMKEYGVKD